MKLALCALFLSGFCLVLAAGCNQAAPTTGSGGGQTLPGVPEGGPKSKDKPGLNPPALPPAPP
jgi:hypothetical protein